MADQSFLDNEETEGLINLDDKREDYNSVIGSIKARFSDAETGRRSD